MEETPDTIGFLGSDGVLYCSRSCALERGRSAGYDVDEDDYDGMVESGALQAASFCPACGAEFSPSWREREPN
jgi:hypothetical protein